MGEQKKKSSIVMEKMSQEARTIYCRIAPELHRQGIELSPASLIKACEYMAAREQARAQGDEYGVRKAIDEYFEYNGEPLQ